MVGHSGAAGMVCPIAAMRWFWAREVAACDGEARRAGEEWLMERYSEDAA